MAALAGGSCDQSVEAWHDTHAGCMDYFTWGGTGDFPDFGDNFGGLLVGGLVVRLESAVAARLSDAGLSPSFGLDSGFHPHGRALVRGSADLVFHTATAGEVRTKPVKVF